MRIVRFQAGGEPKYGVVEDDIVREIAGTVFGRFRPTRKKHPLNRIRFLSPTEPTKIVGVGLNFRDHAAELGLVDCHGCLSGTRSRCLRNNHRTTCAKIDLADL